MGGEPNPGGAADSPPTPAPEQVTVLSHPRRIGWVGTTALAMGGSSQSLFLIGALVAGQGSIPGQGTAAVPLLVIGLLLSWAALPGWTELVLMWPNRVGGVAATCGEAFRPYAPVLGNLTGVSYWWGWIPTCGLTALLSASAIHQWFLPRLPVSALASAILVLAYSGAALSVQADRGQVEQIVLNLAVNARDAMPSGGVLTIETANVELDEHDASTHFSVTPGAFVALTVSDTGTGMTPDVQSHLFEPFYTTKPPGKGTGLGLSTIHGIVTRSGGSVAVYSEVGKGTSFTVYFSRANAEGRVVDAPSLVARPQHGGESMLVVEDVEDLRELTTRLLEVQGYQVLVASNANEALHVFDQHASIDVILTDVVMPGISGPELIEQLRSRRPGLKVICMSGYTEEAIAHHGVLTPGIAFLHKPFTSATLGRKIREALDQ
ncbi:MAG: response regulator [Acidobacteriota bacterium]